LLLLLLLFCLAFVVLLLDLWVNEHGGAVEPLAQRSRHPLQSKEQAVQASGKGQQVTLVLTICTCC
jgi:hypothetical protein